MAAFPSANNCPGMRSTHLRSTYVTGTARTANNLIQLGVAIDTVPGARVYEAELRQLEAALRRLTQEAHAIGERANAIRLRIKDDLLKPKEEHPFDSASTQQ